MSAILYTVFRQSAKELFDIEGGAFSLRMPDPFHRNRAIVWKTASETCSSLTKGATCPCSNWLSTQITPAHRRYSCLLLPFFSLALDRAIAVASRLFQAASVENIYFPSRVCDQSGLLQRSSGDRDGGAGASQHLRQELLGQRKIV